MSKIIGYLLEGGPHQTYRGFMKTLSLHRQLHKLSNQGNLFKELTSEFFLVFVCTILMLEVIVMMFINNGTRNYVSWP